MPLYTYRCPACGRREQAFRKIAQRDEFPFCTCPSLPQVPMTRILEAPSVRGDYAGYECPITGNWIEGRRAHEENLKRHGCRVYEPGETEQFKKRQAAEEEALLEAAGETAAAAFEAMPTEKKEALAVGIQQGLDVSVVRSSYAG